MRNCPGIEMSATEFPKFCISWGHTESFTSGKSLLKVFSFMQFTSVPVSTLTTRGSILGGSNMVKNLKHIYHWWIGLPDSILIDVSVLSALRWCYLYKMCFPASFLGLTYLVEVSYFVAFLAFCILDCTLLSWLVLWFSTSHTLPFHSWGFSRWLTVS